MRELGVLGGERLREPKDLDGEVVAAHAAVGHDADAAADAVGAFAVDEQLVFADGAFAPGTATGDWLLAHEATYAARNRGARGGSEDRVAEDEASAVADTYVTARRVPDAAYVAAVRDLLRAVGVWIEAEDVELLAVQYDAAHGIPRWSLGAERQDQWEEIYQDPRSIHGVLVMRAEMASAEVSRQ